MGQDETSQRWQQGQVSGWGWSGCHTLLPTVLPPLQPPGLREVSLWSSVTQQTQKWSQGPLQWPPPVPAPGTHSSLPACVRGGGCSHGPASPRQKG